MVPDEPQAMSQCMLEKRSTASSSTACAATVARTKASAVSWPSGKKRMDQATLPTRQLSITWASNWRPMMSSVERPPMSTTSRRSSDWGRAWATPW